MTGFIYNADDKRSVNSLISRVFAYMFVGLLITAVVAISVGLIFYNWIYGTLDARLVNAGSVTINTQGVNTLYGVMIVSSLLLIGTSIFITFRFLRNKHSLLIPATLYCMLMGLVLSTFVVFLPWEILGISFLITSGIFGIMALIAFLSKGSLNFLGTIGFGLLIGSMFISLFGFIFYLTGWLEGYMNLYWIISFASFAGMMFITIWDMWRIKEIAQQGEMSENLALYCAFNLYVDFVYIFIRIVYFVARIWGSRN